MCAGKCGRLARTKLFINLDQCILLVLGGILFEGGFDPVVVAEELTDIFVSRKTECAKEGCDINLSVLVDTDIEKVVLIRFVF